MIYIALLLLCISIIVNGLPPPSSQVNVSFQSVQVAAKLARRIVSDAGRGTILTTMDESVSSEFKGYPFGIMEYYSDKCSTNGNLLLFMSDLQMSARNMLQHHHIAFTIQALKDYNPPYFGNHSTPVQQPRFTLFGEIKRITKTDKVMDCFIQTHPEAKPWNSFHDFHFYEFHVKGMYYVGGFGGINYIGWIPVDIYQKAGNALGEEEPVLRIQQ